MLTPIHSCFPLILLQNPLLAPAGVSTMGPYRICSLFLGLHGTLLLVHSYSKYRVLSSSHCVAVLHLPHGITGSVEVPIFETAFELRRAPEREDIAIFRPPEKAYLLEIH